MVFQESKLKYTPKKVIDLPDYIRFHTELNYGEKLFLAELTSMSSNDGIPFSSRKFADMMGVTYQTCLNWLRRLKGLKLIEVSKKDTKNPDFKYILRLNKNLQNIARVD